MNKISNRSGEARLIVILAVIALVLALFAVVPAIYHLADDRLAGSADEQYESAAKSAAQIAYDQEPHAFTMAYDSVHKKLTETGEAASITAYGTASGHEGKILLVQVEEDGSVTLSWSKPEEIAKETY